MFLVRNQKDGIQCYAIKPLYTALLHSIKISGCRMKIKFDKVPLAVEQNNHKTKIVIAYIVYDLDNWPKFSIINFTIKNCFFGVTSIVKNSYKKKRVYSGYRIPFDRKGSWSLAMTMLKCCNFWR